MSKVTGCGIILHAVQIEASFVSPLPRSKRNYYHCGSFQVSLDFSIASNQPARGIILNHKWFRADRQDGKILCGV